MTTELIKRALDSFHVAKRAGEMMPLLPEGVTPSYIRYLDLIGKLKREKGEVRVSDISGTLSVQMPGVTRTINEMEKKGYLRKTSSDTDGRVTYLTITKEGEKLSQKYNEDVFIPLVQELSHLNDDDVETMIKTISIFYSAMCKGRE